MLDNSGTTRNRVEQKLDTTINYQPVAGLNNSLNSQDLLSAKFSRASNSSQTVNAVDLATIGLAAGRNFGSTSLDDFASGVTVDSAGNVYVTGWTQGNLAGTNTGASNAFIIKFSSNLTRLWSQQFPQLSNTTNPSSFNNINDVKASRVAVDNAGNVYVTGTTNLEGSNAGLTDAFITKFNSSGTQQWTTQFGTSDDDFTSGVAVDNAGNIYVTGHTNGNSANTGASFFTKFNSSGNQQWTNYFGANLYNGNYYDGLVPNSKGVFVSGYFDPNAGGVAVDNAGNVYVLDNFSMAKFNSNGTKQWDKIFTSTDPNYPVTYKYLSGVAVDNAGNVYVSGHNDASISKLDSSGTQLWTKDFGGSGSPDRTTGVAVDNAGSVYVVGNTESQSGSSGIIKRSFFAKFDSAGTQLWTAKSLDDGSSQPYTYLNRGGFLASGVVVDSAGYVYISGVDYVNGDASGPKDASIFKVTQPGTQTSITPKTNDFNSDGKSDLVWRNYATGENTVWFMNGANLSLSQNIQSVNDTNWQIVGTGDFNGDGKNDLVWRNSKTGQDVVWFMNGTSLISTQDILAVGDANWHIVGTGDFNGDGKTDLVWRNSKTGQDLVWFMNGTNLISTQDILAVGDTNWQIVGTGDFNGDGKTDLVWRDYKTGQDVIWFMNGTNFISTQNILAVDDTNWHIENVGDFNGDGKTDLVWRNYQTGQDVIWFMNGTNLTSTQNILAVGDPNWHIQPANLV